MKWLKLLGNGYLLLGLLVMLGLFIYDCLNNDKFILHFIGIFLVIPALAYLFWSLSKDTERYVRPAERTQNVLLRFYESLVNWGEDNPNQFEKWLFGFSEIRLIKHAVLRQVHRKIR
jgi:hypothetical protein